MQTKVCRCCKDVKPIDDFYKARGEKYGVSGKCKECTKKAVTEYAKKHTLEISAYHKEYHKHYREKQMRQDAEYKSKIQRLKTPCLKCGEDRLYVIDFHHIEPSKKSFNINRKTAKTNFSIIENEVKKCVCLCRNCHAEFHYLYGQNPKNPREALNEYLNKKENKKND